MRCRITRPMLAAKLKDVDQIKWPMIATPKVDGIRCLNPDGRILSRSFKPIRNLYINTLLSKILPIGSDGELFSSDNFQDCTSDIMSVYGNPDFVYCMFDLATNLDTPYIERLKALDDWIKSSDKLVSRFVKVLPYTVINSKEEFIDYSYKMVSDGYEGSIIRTPNSPYKCGRSTWNEKYLVKWKPLKDSEAIVTGFEEMYHNENISFTNELGLSSRSTSIIGKVPAGTLGNFIAVDITTGVEFKCGTGKNLTDSIRREIWKNKELYLGRIFKYKYQAHGMKEKPRQPIWHGWRDKDDL